MRPRFLLTILMALFGALLSSSLCAQPTGNALDVLSRGRAALSAGELDTATALCREVLDQDPENPWAWMLLGYAKHRAGDLEAARQAHLKAASYPATRVNASYNVACVYALQGDRDSAFSWLGKAIARGFTDDRHATADADLASLREDPRFEEHMQLMREQGQALRVNVAVFVYEGVELLDFAGPGEVFAGSTGSDGRRCYVYTVGGSTEPITSQGFVEVTPEYSTANCPPPDVIVIPGGNSRRAIENTDVVDWLRRTAPQTQVVLSVCTGVFILGRAGLLDGIEATTHWSALAGLERDFPECTVIHDRRFVDNGKVVTSAGVSAGIDGALHTVQKLFGAEAAVMRARGMEYEWTPSEQALPVGKPVTAAASADGADFVCPPCSCKTCGEVHPRDGFCAACGMRLVARRDAEKKG